MTVTMEEAIRIQQMHASGLLSTRTAIEQLGFVEDVDEEMRRLAAQEAEKAK